jgi:hypothetical protein
MHNWQSKTKEHCKRETSNVQEKYKDSVITDEDRESVGHGKQNNPFAVLCDDDDAFGSIEDDGDDNEDADTYDDECDTEEGSGDIDKDDDDTHNVQDDDTNDDQESDTDDEDKEVNEDRDNEYDKDDDDVDVVAGNHDDDGCVDEDDDVDDKQEDEQIDEAQSEDVKAITIESDDIPIGITRPGTRFRDVEAMDHTTENLMITIVPEMCVNLGKTKVARKIKMKKKNNDIKRKAMHQKATRTRHSRLNFRGDEQVTQNTINPKSKSVLHDFATDGKDDHD